MLRSFVFRYILCLLICNFLFTYNFITMDINNFLNAAEQEKVLLALLAGGDLTIGGFGYTPDKDLTLRTKVKKALKNGYKLTPPVAAMMLLQLHNQQFGMDFFFPYIRNFDKKAADLLIKVYGREHIWSICVGKQKFWDQISWTTAVNMRLACYIDTAASLEYRMQQQYFKDDEFFDAYAMNSYLTLDILARKKMWAQIAKFTPSSEVRQFCKDRAPKEVYLKLFPVRI